MAQPAPAAPFVAKAVGPLTLAVKEKSLDGMLKPSTFLFSLDDEVLFSYKRSDYMVNASGMSIIIKDASGAVVGVLKHGDLASYKKGLGRAILYAPTPPDG